MGNFQTADKQPRNMNNNIVDDETLSDRWNTARYETITRGRAKNNSQGTLDNLRRNTVDRGREFQEIGVYDPAEITKESFTQWIENLKQKPLSNSTIKKRVTTLKGILEANKLQEPEEFVSLWKAEKEVKEIRYWTIEELEAMNTTAISLFQNDKMKPRAMSHLIFSMMAPRISDVAKFRWDYFDFNKKQICFRATKNRKNCYQYMEERFIPLIKQYQSWIGNFAGGKEFLFPQSIIHSSGTTKRELDCVTDKTVRKWLKEIRDVSFVNNEPVQKLPSHSFRHSLSMRYLNAGGSFENVALVLGDDIGTLEAHYAELIPNKSQRIAFERAHKMATAVSSEGTAQPDFLLRRRGSNSNWVMPLGNAFAGFRLEDNGGHWGI